MWIEEPAFSSRPAERILIETTADPAATPVRQIVKLVAVDDPIFDPLFKRSVVRIAWRAEDALTADHDLSATRVCGNVVPATQGRRAVDRFVVGAGRRGRRSGRRRAPSCAPAPTGGRCCCTR